MSRDRAGGFAYFGRPSAFSQASATSAKLLIVTILCSVFYLHHLDGRMAAAVELGVDEHHPSLVDRSHHLLVVVLYDKAQECEIRQASFAFEIHQGGCSGWTPPSFWSVSEVCPASFNSLISNKTSLR